MPEPKKRRPAGELGERVTEALRQTEKAVVGRYARIEEAVVSRYARIEDAFVERHLVREGETLEAAKRRLKGAGRGAAE